jgi:hypothetical protein
MSGTRGSTVGAWSVPAFSSRDGSASGAGTGDPATSRPSYSTERPVAKVRWTVVLEKGRATRVGPHYSAMIEAYGRDVLPRLRG